MKHRVLVIEDDAAISMALCDRLRSEGYAVECVADGSAGFGRAVGAAWDLLILDLMLPGKEGLELCRDVRAKGIHVPILMLTARGETVDKVVGLKMGADDYLAKPFEMIELIARVEALLRRGGGPVREADMHAVGPFTLDTRRGVLRRDRTSIPLTTYELKLLSHLAEHRGETVSRDTLLNRVWGYDAVPATRTVDIHVASLRKKLGDSRRQQIIVTVRGQGYRLAE